MNIKFLSGALALVGVVAITTPVLADQAAQVVAGNSASRIIREPAAIADAVPAPQAVVAGNSASRIIRDSSDAVALIDPTSKPVATAAPIVAAVPATLATIAPTQSPPVVAQPTMQPAWVGQVLTDTMHAEQIAMSGDTVTGNSVSRIAGYSDVPLTCADCSSKPWLTRSRMCRYGAQIADAIVVAAAVRGGKHERIGFGNRPNPLAYMLALGAEDYIADNVIGADNPHVQMALNYTMCGASLFNAVKSLKH